MAAPPGHDADYPTQKMQAKTQSTVRNEKAFLRPVRVYFADKPAASVTLADCDRYRDCRFSGGYVSTYKVRGGHEHTERTVVRHRLAAACRKLGIGHVTPHGLRSYFVTQARQSNLTDAEIAMLIGDKTGPAPGRTPPPAGEQIEESVALK